MGQPQSFSGVAIPTQVGATMGPTDVTATVLSTAGWPNTTYGSFVITINEGNATEEKVLVGAYSGTALSSLTRGYDGTTAATHQVGESIIHSIDGAWHQDVSQKLYNGVKGSLYYWSATGTPGQLAIGAAGSILQSLSGVPAWLALGAAGTVLQGGASAPSYGVLPGTLLATQQYAPGSLQTVPLTATLSKTDVNHTLSFTIPASGNVDVDVMCYVVLTEATQNNDAAIGLGLIQHGTSTQVGYTTNAIDGNVVGTGVQATEWAGMARVRFHLTTAPSGWTPGASFQVDLAAAVSTVSNAAGYIYVIGVTGNPSAGNGGPLLMQAFAG